MRHRTLKVWSLFLATLAMPAVFCQDTTLAAGFTGSGFFLCRGGPRVPAVRGQGVTYTQ